MRASHKVMTGAASNFSLGPRINSALSNRMGKRGMPFVAINTRGNFISTVQQLKVGSVGTMAVGAFSFHN
jgi:hypothetical protein